MTDPTRARVRLLTAFRQENWPMVLHRATALLQEAPDDAELHFMCGVAHAQSGQLPQALDALHEATRRAPDRPGPLAHYARALALVRRLREARDAADRAMAQIPDDPELLHMLGEVFMQCHAIEPAADAFGRAVQLKPDHAAGRLSLGHALAALGDVAGAEKELEACVRIQPRHWPAYLHLSKLKRQTGQTQHLERLHDLLQRHGNDTGARIFLNMALGKEYEDLASYPQAFEHYARGKAAARATRPASAERDRAMFDALIRAFPDRQPEPGDHAPPDAPIFIIGMPRTGTTLLNRILSSHPDVYPAGELQNFPTQLQRISGSRVALLSLPDIDAHTRHVDWRKLGRDYIESTRPATADRPRFTDDMPHNFLYAGFIARALPKARMICLRRDPLDTCLGNFRHLFRLESGFYDYSLDLLDTGRYYIQFERLMAHWRAVLPGRILELSYASLVETPDVAIRRALAFCGLPWHDDCLHSERNTAPVSTPSAWQVRAPIYTTALGRWRHYAAQIQPLRTLLLKAGVVLQD